MLRERHPLPESSGFANLDRYYSGEDGEKAQAIAMLGEISDIAVAEA